MTELADRIDKIAEGLERDRREPDKVLTYVAHLRRVSTDLRRDDVPCTVVINHGPGHQSRTACQERGPHTVHRAVYGSHRQEAEWTGGDVFSGFFDEPPKFTEPEEQ